jgi:hypothetical protein
MSKHDDPTRFGRFTLADIRAAQKRERRTRWVWMAGVLILMLGLVALLVWGIL